MCYETTGKRLLLPLQTTWKKGLLFIVILIVAALLPASAQNCTDIPAGECQALNALYNTTGGGQWTDNSNWLTSGPASDRFGITVEGGHVTEIDLAFNNLTGTFPTDLVHHFLESLVNLETLDLHFNNLTGTIPPELGNMTSLEWIYLNQNDFTGEIPPELANLPNLLRLNVYGNNLTGTIPPELGNLSSLYFLDLYDNNLTGTIPPELGNLSNLVALSLHENQLSGSIPQQLGNLADLEFLNLYSNSLTGTIPPELGNLSKLRGLALNSNNLSGNVPAFLASPPDTVNLSYNCLYATQSAVLAAMETKHNNNFMSTQTVAPENVTAETIEYSGTEENRIRVSWDPISYLGNEGGYQVFYRKTTDIGYHYYGMTTDKNISSMIVSNLEPGVEYTFLVDSFTWAHDNNQNDLQSRDSNTPSAVSGTLSRAFVPAWKQAPGYWTGVVVSNFGDSDFDLTLSAYGENGALETLNNNPRAYKVEAGKQMSRLGSEFLGNAGHEALSWIELKADNSNKMGSIFLFGVSDTRMMDGAESQSSYAKKLYFTRPLDEWFIGGRNPDIQMCLVNPTDEEVTVRCVLKGANGEPEKIHTIPPRGFIAGDAEDLIIPNHGIYNGYMEIEVTEGPGVVGFSRIEYPGVRTALGMNAVKPSTVKKMYSAQLAHGSNIVTNLRLVNTSNYRRAVTLTAIGDNGTPLADPVHAVVYARQIYNADLGTLFGLEGEGVVNTGSLVVESDGVGVIGDIIFAEGNTMEYAMSLPLQEKLFQEAVFNHISNLPTVFTGFAFYNPGDETATVLIEAFNAEEGDKIAEKTLILGPGERIARTLNDPDIWPTFPIQSGGYIRIRSDQPIAGQQLFGDRALRYMAAVPPTTRVEGMFD